MDVVEPTNSGPESDLTTVHVRAAARGERESLEWVVARFTPLLLMQAAHRLHGPLRRVVEPEDLVQDVWVRALPRIAELRPRDGRMTVVVARFLGTTLLNRLNSLLQKRLEGDGEPLSAGAPPPEPTDDATRALSGLVRRERERAVRAAIEELSAEDRAVIVLRGIEQNPVQEVALLLGLLPNTVAVRYGRALEKLRRKLPGSVFEDLAVGGPDAA
jgi:RNA polymerase sigma factor (sigma-70 family)